MMIYTTTAVALLAALGAAQKFSIATHDDIVASAKTIAFDLMTLYSGNETGGTPGLLPGPPPSGDYWWWEGAGFLATFVDYWHVTGDETYNDVVTQGLLFQRGPDDNYMNPNFTAQLSNDDQCAWALASMIAAENNFPEPPKGQASWAAVALNAFNTMVPRYDDDTCGGGLRWQVLPFNKGYDYKNTMSNGCYFNLGARLARYTGNDTYAQQAIQTWDWLTSIGFIDNTTFAVFDGAQVEGNCTDINKVQFSYPAALLTQGAAYMYNYTQGSTLWKNRLDSLLTATLKTFFPNNVAVEVACEARATCSTDMLSFKNYLHRYLSGAAQLAPYAADKILAMLKTSAQAAVGQCTGGRSGRQCGFYWADGKFVKPSTTGVGEQMDVLGAVEALLVEGAAGPVTAATGSGNSTSGSGGSGSGSGSGTSTGSAPKGSETSAAKRIELGLVAGLIGLTGLVIVNL